MNAKNRIFGPLFAVAVLMVGGTWIASANVYPAGAMADDSAYEYDYLPSQLVDPTAAFGEAVETF